MKIYEGRAFEEISLNGMRKTIATRMHESLQSMAQLTMDMDVVMDDAVKLRGQLIEEWEDEGIRPSYTDLVIRAAAKALEVHPLMNSRFDESEMTLLGEVNVGMAVALDAGIGQFNIESEAELAVLSDVAAARGAVARIAMGWPVLLVTSPVLYFVIRSAMRAMPRTGDGT